MTHDEALEFVPYYEGALEAHIDELDVVIGHHGNLVAFAVSRVCGATSTPYVIFLHGTGIEPRHDGGYDDQLWDEISAAVEGAAGLIVTTDYVRDSLAGPLFEAPVERYLVLPCGIDLQEFHPDRNEGAAERFGLTHPYVICPGALTAVKGPQNVVAASRAYGDLAPTVFIGAGELESRLRDDLDDRGELLGFVSSADKADLICNAALLVAAPEKKEHFGIIYAEALAGGTPCVAYEGGGVDSIVTPDVGTLTARTPGALGRAVRALLSDTPRRDRMAAEARVRAQDRFDAENLTSILDEWLHGFVDGSTAVDSTTGIGRST